MMKYNMLRLSKAACIGVIAGMLLLAVFFTPLAIYVLNMQMKAAFHQDKLIPAQGEGPQTYLSSVTLHAQVSESEYGMAVTTDFYSWYVPENGAVRLDLTPGRYDQIGAAFGNRVVITGSDITDGQNNLILDVDKAPVSPEYELLECGKGVDRIFPLDISAAVEVVAVSAPDWITVIRDGDGFALAVNGRNSQFGFWHIILQPQNENGYAMTHIGLRILRDAEVIPIYSVEDFEEINDKLSGNYVLMNDLNMTGVQWQPIGTQQYPFTGIFDGNGHEITGLSSPNELIDTGFSLFGFVKNAEIRNLIVFEPTLDLQSEDQLNCAVLCVDAETSLVTGCAVVGGNVTGKNVYCSGLIANARNSVFINLFNSANVTATAPNRTLPNTGGIAGQVWSCYIAQCANEGEIKGNHLTGGIVGYNNTSDIYRCINSGYVWGSTLVGEFPAGGIMQTTDGGSASYSYFVSGTAALGGRVFDSGIINSLIPVASTDLHKPDALRLLGQFDGEHPMWAYSAGNANGPVPYGIFRSQSETWEGGNGA